MTALLSLFGGSTFKLVAILLAVFALVGAGAYEEHQVDLGTINGLKAQYATDKAAAISAAMLQQKRYDTDAIAAAGAERDQQAALASQLQQNQQEVVRYVPTIKSCVPLGLVRVLRAAAIGVSTGNVSLPAGKSDDACAGVEWPDLARSIISDFGTARANAVQLNALIGFMRKAQGEAK